MEKEQLQALFNKYQEGKCTEEEKALLEAWYLQLNEQETGLSAGRVKAIQERVFRELPGNHFAFLEIGLKLLAAVALLGIAVLVALRLLVPGTPLRVSQLARDIGPGRDKATLTLAGGRKVDLNDAANGRLASQGGIQILKTANGQITYDLKSGSDGLSDTVSNTISTPRGGQWQVTLPDGSRVWLNSATRLMYPASFSNQAKRVVRLEGEAYFEVAKDKKHPFMVRSNGQEVEVLGTHFNINSYADEGMVKTTLAEGSVKVSLTGGLPRFLVPGQQAVLKGGELRVSEADIGEALAWKEGYFRFHDEGIRSIMRKLARWYDIEVSYDPGVPLAGLNGKVSRYKNISQVLKALEATRLVHFQLEGRRVTVMK